MKKIITLVALFVLMTTVAYADIVAWDEGVTENGHRYEVVTSMKDFSHVDVQMYVYINDWVTWEIWNAVDYDGENYSGTIRIYHNDVEDNCWTYESEEEGNEVVETMKGLYGFF